ncbi:MULTISPECIES: AI-2E family transporter [Thermococcus]|uniref:AI-2E family transporter n=1 Tax=Thermococcus TaxID=2263 RepID=UPI001431C31A|nr:MULTISPECIES: AI-2E family transporter [Thermococcus]NJE48806.1 AI-2E family transporter [Thermococcus sp. 9N3]CAI1494007.1 Putative permease [Thermococcus nautili]
MELETAVWIGVSLGVLYLTWQTVSPVLSPLIVAVTLAYILYPLHERLSVRIGNRWSALLLTGLLTVFSFLFILGFALWINDIKHSLTDYVDTFFAWLLGLNLPSGVYDLLNKLSSAIAERFNSYVLGYTYSLPKLSLQIIVAVFAFYGVLVNARAIKDEIYALLPPSREELARKLINSATETLHYLLRGWLLVSVGKGAVLAFLFYVLGISDAGGSIAAGILVVILELLPVVGGWIVWSASSIYLFTSGLYWKALAMGILGFILVSPTPDIVLSKRLGKRQWGVNALVSLVGIFGGYIAFGFVGIIIGPVSLSLLITLLEEWKRAKNSKWKSAR